MSQGVPDSEEVDKLAAEDEAIVKKIFHGQVRRLDDDADEGGSKVRTASLPSSLNPGLSHVCSSLVFGAWCEGGRCRCAY